MNIVIDGRYIQDRFPGIGRYTFNLIRALGKLDTGDDLVIIINRKLPNRRFDFSTLTGLPRCQLVDTDIARYLPAEIIQLPSFVRRLCPDVYHSPFFLRPYPLPCPCVVTIHDLIPLLRPRRVGELLNALMVLGGSLLAIRSSHIVTVSEHSASTIRKYFHIPHNQVDTIPEAPDPNFQQLPEDKIDPIRKKLGLQKPYVLHVGSHLPHKNQQRLLTAWKRFKQLSDGGNYPHQLVLVGGEGNLFLANQKLAARLKIDDSVLFFHHVPEDDLPALYCGADFFIFPSYAEGFGLPVVEAMACGTPVICSAIPPLLEVVAGTALIVDPEDIDGLSGTMMKLLGSPRLQKHLSEMGRHRSRQYSWRATALKTYGVYRRAVRVHSAKRYRTLI